MKFKLLLLSGVILVSFNFHCQLTNNTDCQLPKKSHIVRVKEGAYPGKVSSEIIPRKLKPNEKCLIENQRLETEILVLSLDEIHEVLIYPRNQIKE